MPPAAIIDDAQVIRLYVEDGLNLRECAAKLGSSTKRLTRILEAHGVARRPPGAPPLSVQPPCGTIAAYERHRIRGERCQKCWNYFSAYRRASRLACNRLIAEYPARYNVLVGEEMGKVEAAFGRPVEPSDLPDFPPAPRC